MQFRLLGIKGATDIGLVAGVTRKLTEEELINVLATTNLTDANIRAIAAMRGLNWEEQQAFLQKVKNAAATEVETLATKELGTATTGTGAALKAFFADPIVLATIAIYGLVTAIKHIRGKLKEVADEAKEMSSISYEKMNTVLENQKSLDDLISKYKDLAKSGKQDAETRNEILTIQNNIVDIVGNQAGKLDLVNGKLDTEIDKLKKIRELNLTNEANKIEESVYSSSSSFQALIEANTASHWYQIKSGEGAISKDDPLYPFKGMNYGEMVAAIEQELKFIRQSNPNYIKNEYYKKLSEIYDEMAGQDGEFTKYQESAKNWLSNLTQRTIGEGETIESIDEYYTYRQSLIDSIMDDNTIQKIVSDGVMSQDEIRNYVDSQLGAIEKYTDFYKQWSKEDSRQTQLKELSKAFRRAMLPDELDTAKNNQAKKQFDSWISGLSDEELDIVYKISLDTDTASWGLVRWQAALENQKNATKAAAESNAKSLTSIGEALDEDTKSVEAYIKSINSVEKILSSQKNGKSISLTDFNADELKDYRSALEYVNGTMQLNIDKVNEIAKAKAEEQIETNKVNKAMAQSKYLDNARQIAVYREELKTTTDEKEKLNLQTKVDDLLKENEALVTTCTSYDLLSSSLKEATSSYQHWLNAINASDYGDMFTDAQSAIKRITDTFNEDSDVFGQFGSKKFDAAVDFIVPDSVDVEDTEAIQKYMDSLKKFFYYDDKGEMEGLDIEQFCKEAVAKGLMVLDSASDEYKIAGGKTMEDFAEGLNLSSGLVQAFFDEMQLYGGKFDWGDEAVKTMGDLAIEANEAAEALRNIPTNKGLIIKLDYSDIETVDGQLKAIDSTMKEMERVKTKPNVDSSEIEYANSILEYCLRQKQALTAPDIMRVDVSQVKGDLGEAITLLQDFQNAENEKEILKQIGVDTIGAEQKINELGTKIQGISPDIKTQLKLDTTSTTAIQKSIDGLSTKALVKLGIDESAITGYNPDTKECEVIYKPDTNLLPEEKDFEEIEREVHYYATGLGSLPSAYELGVINREVHYYKTGDIDLNGTAHASGTANASGDWGTAKGGKTLVGELGTEIIVSPRTGKWYTVGENGAQFVDVPEGAIVFNHAQTKSLLENGYVSGRAHALVSGTAMVTGGIKGRYAKGTTTRKNKIEAEVAEAAAEEIANTIPDTDSNNSEDSFKYIDRVEIFIDRIQRRIKNLSTSIKDIFSLWTDRGDGITKQIRNITEEIDIQKGAAQRYLEEARKQIDKYDLNPEWVKSLETGNLGFIYLTNLDELHEGYQEYLKWFEKYLDCRDSIVGLEQDLSQLYKDQFDNIKKNYENQIDLSEYLRDSEEKTYSQTTTYFDDMRGVYSKNLELLTNEAKDLEEQLRKAVDDGAIEVGSEAWQEMKKEINGVTKEISKTNVELAKLYTEQFDYIQNNYKNQISSYESLNDANEKNFTATTNYYKEMREISNKTLKSQQEELVALEKEFDEAMASGRIKEGSEAWYKMRGAIDDTKRSIAQTRVEQKQLYLDQFDYIQKGYQNQLSLYNHYANVYSKKQTLVETQGYMTSSILLNEQSRVQQQNYSKLKEELVDLEAEYVRVMATGEIERFSDAWYDLTEKINGVKEALIEARTEMVKLDNAKEELAESGFSLNQSLISELKDESDFYINMMSFVDLYNKQGKLTNTGLATLGLHDYNVGVNKKLKEGYDSEIARIDEKYVNDKNNTKYLEYRRQLIKSRQEAVVAIENEEKAMISMAENGIKLELDNLKDLISTYKESIDAAKSLYGYQKNIAEKSKKVADIQKQLSAYTNDSSEETKATVQKLKVSLEESQKDLRETEYTQMVADQKKLLDEVYSEFEAFLNSSLDDRNALLADLKAEVNLLPDAIGNTLKETADAIGVPLSESLENTWANAAANLEQWNKDREKDHETDREITRQTVIDASTSWGNFGNGMIAEQSNLKDAISGENGLSIATSLNTEGINKIYGDIGVRGGQTLIDKEDEDYAKLRGAIKNDTENIGTTLGSDIGKIDSPNSTINTNLSTLGEQLKNIDDTAKDILDEANNHIYSNYLGDLDADENLTANDALQILRASVGLEELTDAQKILADVDKDGSVTAADALLALRMSTGLEDVELLEDILKEMNKKSKSYSTGGLIDYTGKANVHGSKSKPELVLNATDTQNFIKLNNILRDVMKTQSGDLLSGLYGVDSPALQLAKIPNAFSGINKPELTQNTTINLGGIAIDHVEDYNDFVNQLKTDSKFEKMIRSMTTGELNGGRSIDKYKYRW